MKNGITYKNQLLYKAQQKNGTWGIFYGGHKFMSITPPGINAEYASEADAEEALRDWAEKNKGWGE